MPVNVHKKTINFTHPYAYDLAKCGTCGAWETEPCFDMRSKMRAVGPVKYKTSAHRGRRRRG